MFHLLHFKTKCEAKYKRFYIYLSFQNFIVDKTEKYSTLLAESMAESASLKTTPTASDSEMGGHMDDDDYQPDQVKIWIILQIKANHFP